VKSKCKRRLKRKTRNVKKRKIREPKHIEEFWPRLLTRIGSKLRLKKRSSARRKNKWREDKASSMTPEEDHKPVQTEQDMEETVPED